LALATWSRSKLQAAPAIDAELAKAEQEYAEYTAETWRARGQDWHIDNLKPWVHAHCVSGRLAFRYVGGTFPENWNSPGRLLTRTPGGGAKTLQRVMFLKGPSGQVKYDDCGVAPTDEAGLVWVLADPNNQ